MKRFIPFLLACMLCLSLLSSCGNGKNTSQEEVAQVDITQGANDSDESDSSETEKSEDSESTSEAPVEAATDEPASSEETTTPEPTQTSADNSKNLFNALTDTVILSDKGVTAKLTNINAERSMIAYSVENQNSDNKKIHFYVSAFTFNNLMTPTEASGNFSDWWNTAGYSTDGILEKGDTWNTSLEVKDYWKEYKDVLSWIDTDIDDTPIMEITLYWQLSTSIQANASGKYAATDWEYGRTTIKTNAYDETALNNLIGGHVGDFTVNQHPVSVYQPETDYGAACVLINNETDYSPEGTATIRCASIPESATSDWTLYSLFSYNGYAEKDNTRTLLVDVFPGAAYLFKGPYYTEEEMRKKEEIPDGTEIVFAVNFQSDDGTASFPLTYYHNYHE